MPFESTNKKPEASVRRESARFPLLKGRSPSVSFAAPPELRAHAEAHAEALVRRWVATLHAGKDAVDLDAVWAMVAPNMQAYCVKKRPDDPRKFLRQMADSRGTRYHGVRELRLHPSGTAARVLVLLQPAGDADGVPPTRAVEWDLHFQAGGSAFSGFTAGARPVDHAIDWAKPDWKGLEYPPDGNMANAALVVTTFKGQRPMVVPVDGKCGLGGSVKKAFWRYEDVLTGTIGKPAQRQFHEKWGFKGAALSPAEEVRERVHQRVHAQGGHGGEAELASALGLVELLFA